MKILHTVLSIDIACIKKGAGSLRDLFKKISYGMPLPTVINNSTLVNEIKGAAGCMNDVLK